MIYFKVQGLDIQMSETNIKILNSYTQTNKDEMFEILTIIRNKAPSLYVSERTLENMVGEWIAHNICYTLGICRSRTKDTDFEVEITNEFLYSIYNFLGKRR